MKVIYLDIPNNIQIIGAGTGIYNNLTITELVAENSSFWLEDGKLYTETVLNQFLVAGTVDGVGFVQVFSEE